MNIKLPAHALAQLFLAIVILITVTSIFTVILASANSPVRAASPSWGGVITEWNPFCRNVLGVCTCSLCGTVGVCDGYQEIQYTPATGSVPPPFVCPFSGYPIQGSLPVPGFFILGEGTPQAPLQIGVGPP